MRIVMIGSGYVGLVSSACFAECGVPIRCIDRDSERVAALQRCDLPIYEPGLAELVVKGIQSGRLSFSSDLPAGVAEADVIFIAVGTPERRGDRRADLTFVHAATAEIAPHLRGYTIIATKSTVPVGSGRGIIEIIQQMNPAADFAVCANPEFLREGAAIRDFMEPYRVVLGLRDDDRQASTIMTELYRRLTDRPIIVTNLESAELIKYAANAFLASKITFINEMADLCEKVGADVHDVAYGIGLDERIGPQFLQVGPGYGGSCFPKDVAALMQIAKEQNSRLRILEATHTANEHRQRRMSERIIQLCGGSIEGLKLTVLGVTFKPDTDDMRESPALAIIPALQRKGARLQAFDPAGMDKAAKQLPGVSWSRNAYHALEGADAAVVLTDWSEFRRLDLARARQMMHRPVMIDFRNIYEPALMAHHGFQYSCLGRAAISLKPRVLDHE